MSNLIEITKRETAKMIKDDYNFCIKKGSLTPWQKLKFINAINSLNNNFFNNAKFSLSLLHKKHAINLRLFLQYHIEVSKINIHAIIKGL